MCYLYTTIIIKYPSFFKKIIYIFLILQKFGRNKKIKKNEEPSPVLFRDPFLVLVLKIF